MKKLFCLFIMLTTAISFCYAENAEKFAVEIGVVGVNDHVSVNSPQTAFGAMVGLSYDNFVVDYGQTIDNNVMFYSGHAGYNVDVYHTDNYSISVVPMAGIFVYDLKPVNKDVMEFDYGIGIRYKVNRIAVSYKMYNKFGAGFAISFDIN